MVGSSSTPGMEHDGRRQHQQPHRQFMSAQKNKNLIRNHNALETRILLMMNHQQQAVCTSPLRTRAIFPLTGKNGMEHGNRSQHCQPHCWSTNAQQKQNLIQNQNALEMRTPLTTIQKQRAVGTPSPRVEVTLDINKTTRMPTNRKSDIQIIRR